MRCVCCNKSLSDYESTIKHAVTGQYLDTCLRCLSSIEEYAHVPTKERKDLRHTISEDGDSELDGVFDVDQDTSDIDLDNFKEAHYNNTIKDYNDT